MWKSQFTVLWSAKKPVVTIHSCRTASPPQYLLMQGKYNCTIITLYANVSMDQNCLWVAMTTPTKIKPKMVFMMHIYLELILSSRLFNGQQGIIIQNFSTRSILTVTNVTQEHFGNYTCVAANKLGATNASLPLNRK